MAGKKKKEEKIPILAEEEEIKKAIAKYKREEPALEAPEKELGFESREFKEFQANYMGAYDPRSFFEKACRFSGKHLHIGIKKADEDKLNDIIYFTGLRVKAADIISLSILTFLVFLIFSGIFILIFYPLALVMFMVGLALLVGIQQYPNYLQRVNTVSILNAMPLAITYLVIFMRGSAQLEGAVQFAAKHLRGPMARDMRKICWDVESGTYLSMDMALIAFSNKWKDRNKPFASAIELIRNSEKISNEKERLATLDEAASVMLQGNLDIMKTFARGLRMPVMVLYMLGIVLPVMGLVIAPVMTTMMAQGLSANSLSLVYNLMLPLSIFFMIKIVLSKRPGGFSRPDIKHYPGMPAPGYIRIGTHEIRLIYLSLAAFVIIGFPGILLLFEPAPGAYSLSRIIRSMMLVWGTSIAIIIYTLGGSAQKLKIRNSLEDLEKGMDTALYVLSERIAMGTPLEKAIAQAPAEMKDGPLKDFFARTSTNMRNMGVTVDEAVFNQEYGALRYFPSNMLRTMLEVMLESTKKGLTAASTTLKMLGLFLGNLKKVKEEIENLVGPTVSSMKFQAQFLTSFISGVIVALDILLFKILSQLGEQVTSFELPNDASASAVAGIFQSSMFNVASAVPAEHMQIVVGIYMIQVTVLLSMLINGVMNGRDKIYENHTIGMNLLTGTVVYTIALIVGMIMFSGSRMGMGV